MLTLQLRFNLRVDLLHGDRFASDFRGDLILVIARAGRRTAGNQIQQHGRRYDQQQPAEHNADELIPAAEQIKHALKLLKERGKSKGPL